MSSSALPSHHARGVVSMVLSAVCFTANILLIRALGRFQSVDVWTITCVRFLAGLIVLSLAYWREFQPAHLFTRGKLVSRGLVGGLSVAGYYVTVVQIGAGRATFINNTYIIIGALLAVWLLAERFHRALIIGGAAALVGLGLLTNAFAADTHPGFYDLLGVGTAFASAYVVVTIRQLHATEHTSTIFSAQCVYGLLICCVPAALHLESVSATAWGVMTAAGVCAAVGQIAMTHSFRDLPVAEGSLLQMLTPLGVAAGGIVCFHEHFSPHEIAGAALILAGTAFTVLRR